MQRDGLIMRGLLVMTPGDTQNKYVNKQFSDANGYIRIWISSQLGTYISNCIDQHLGTFEHFARYKDINKSTNDLYKQLCICIYDIKKWYTLFCMCWWRFGDVWVMCWWFEKNVLVMFRWCVGNVLEMFCWYFNAALVMYWWCLFNHIYGIGLICVWVPSPEYMFWLV